MLFHHRTPVVCEKQKQQRKDNVPIIHGSRVKDARLLTRTQKPLMREAYACSMTKRKCWEQLNAER